MGRRYPYDRFLQFDLTPLEQLRYGLLRPWWRLQAWFNRLWYSPPFWRWIGEPEEALPWLQRSVAITPGSGRTHMQIAAIHHRAGRTEQARAAMAEALRLRPGSTAKNVALPAKNASPIFLEAAQKVRQAFVEAGLPPG